MTSRHAQRAYEILSKSVTVDTLRTIKSVIEERRIDMDINEAVTLYKNHIVKYMQENGGKEPDSSDSDPLIRRMAQAMAFIRRKKQEALSSKM